jgi:hypothetical protein
MAERSLKVNPNLTDFCVGGEVKTAITGVDKNEHAEWWQQRNVYPVT